MVEGVTAVRVVEVRKAAAAAAMAATADVAEKTVAVDADLDVNVGGGGGGGRVDVLVDVRTGADYVMVPPGATKEHGGALLPLSTRKEFKKQLRATVGIQAAMKAAATWAAAALHVGVTGAGIGGNASDDESGLARASDIGKKRADRATSAGHSHSHSHSDSGGEIHSHSHGGHSHGPSEALVYNHIGHSHSGGKSQSEKKGGKFSGTKARKSGSKAGKVIDHRSSSWARSGSKRAVRGLSAQEVERKVGVLLVRKRRAKANVYVSGGYRSSA
jgi:rhodanese-related sulfurtransferase